VRVNWDTAGLVLNVPIATYRVQLNRDFGFSDLKAVVPYLAKLGVSHIYASPIFQARAGSMHGYDTVDSTMISDELGGEEGFEDLIKETKEYGLGWLQDIVPNHAAYSLENKRIIDLWQNGPNSRYGRFFDIDWNHPSPELNGRVLVPFLAKELAECLRQKEIALAFEDGGFKIKYGVLEFPVNDKSTQKLFQGNVEQTVERFNKNPEQLNALLSEQFFALACWRDAFGQINYRRFFDILDLIGVQVEDPAVFEETHRLALQMTGLGKFGGLRVDHIDGMHDPEQYLQTLRHRAQDAYLLVEKILTGKETLPESWPIQGSTGYDFINYLNGLFVKQENEAAFNGIYGRFTDKIETFAEVLFECKKTVIRTYFQGDIDNLARLLNQTLQNLSQNQFDPDKMSNAVAALIACFPVYRTYLSPTDPTDQKGHLNTALNQAKQQSPETTKELDQIGFLVNQCRKNLTALKAIMRLQQFTGAVMAKGLEDTSFYRYCLLLSLNEVGGNPSKFGFSQKEFSDYILARQTYWPFSLNASSTHDTKRGEDARARLNVLSELPQEFEVHLFKWTETNSKHKSPLNGELAPDANEEYLIYQTLLSAYPVEETLLVEFTLRAAGYMVKALREAKIHTSWLNSNAQYENAVIQFLNQILRDHSFLDDFLPFQKKLAYYGFYNTLSQTLLKITCPGVPDFYQGSELWNLSMVDPDNRLPIDYQKRKNFLEEVSKSASPEGLLENYPTGKAKLYLIIRALQVRRRLKALFEQGTYVPLNIEGELSEHIFAFMRVLGGNFVVVVVPRFLVGLLEPQSEWGIDWKDTEVKLPSDAPTKWKEAFTDSSIDVVSGRLPVGEVLGGFPVALLVGGDID
jgi:(1->4)-alpha-D-glucan 1-alpha-D-glucosylmutase